MENCKIGNDKTDYLFNFGKNLSNLFRNKTKCKKDFKFANLLICLVFEKKMKLKKNLLFCYNENEYKNMKNKKNEIDESEENLKLEKKLEIENKFEKILEICKNKSNFSEDLKAFNKFQNIEFCENIIHLLLII